MEETVRLNKFLSEKGICSRREADRLVDEGKVMVNGVCAVMGQKVSSADEIVVDGKKVSTKQVKPVLIAVNNRQESCVRQLVLRVRKILLIW